MFFSKQKQDLFPDLSEQNLQYLFQILSEIQEQQYKAVPHSNYKMIEALFDIIGHVSILHDQINHLSHQEGENSEHVLKLNRITVEKSISQFFNLNQKEEYDIHRECSLTINPVIAESSEDSFIEDLPLKDTHIIMTKMQRPISKERSNYLRVNRSLHSSSQKFIHASAGKENAKTNTKAITKPNTSGNSSFQSQIIYNQLSSKKKTSTTNNNTNTQINTSTHGSCGSYNEKKSIVLKKGRLVSDKSVKVKQPISSSTKTLPSKSRISSNYNYCTEQKSKWITSAMTSAPKTPKKRKVNNLKRNLSQETSLDGDYCNSSTREINKPTRYTKYLMNKYKGVIDNYGEEMRNSLNSSLKKPRSSSKAEFAKIDPITLSCDPPIFHNIQCPTTSAFQTLQITKSAQK